MRLTTPIVCTKCGQRFPIETERVVDLAAEPFLRNRLVRGAMNYAQCPQCGSGTPTDLCFLVNDPEAERVIFFVPNGTSPDDAAEQEQILRNVLTIFEDENAKSYYSRPVHVGEWDEFIGLLTKGPEEASTSNSDPIMAALQAVTGADSWQAKGEIVSRHPELMDAVALLWLTNVIQAAREAGEREVMMVGLITRTFLERCRAHGVGHAVVELGEITSIAADESGGTRGTLSRAAVERLDELLVEELEDIFRRSSEQHPAEARYVLARSEEALRSSVAGETKAWLHLTAGIAIRHLASTSDAAAVAARAAIHLEAGLKAIDEDIAPELYADLQNELGLAHLDLPGGDRLGHLQQAIVCFHAALRHRSREDTPEKWAAIHNNIGMALTRLTTHDWTEQTRVAITHFENARIVFAHSLAPRMVATVCSNLGTAHARLVGEQGELEAAIESYTLALDMEEGDGLRPPERASCLVNRAQAYLESLHLAADERFKRAAADAEAAIGLLTPNSDVKLAAAAYEIKGRTHVRAAEGRPDAVQDALTDYRRASDFLGPGEAPDLVRRIDGALGDLYLMNGDPARAQESYGRALSAHETLYVGAVDDIGHFVEAGSVTGLYDRDAFAHLRTGRYQTALLRLDAGRARVIGERLALDHVQLAVLDPPEREAFVTLRQTIRSRRNLLRVDPFGADPSLRREIGTLNRQLLEILERIHQTHPEAIPSGLSKREISSVVPAGGALVYFMVTPAGSAALVVPASAHTLGDSHVVWLDELTDDQLQRLLRGPGGWLAAYLELALTDSDAALEQWRKSIVEMGKYLWDWVLAPLDRRLRELGLRPGAPIVLLPSASLALLPLHAGWRSVNGEQRAFLDDWTVSYAPSGFALAVCAQRVRDRAGGARTLVGVANPNNDLPSTVDEMNAIGAYMDAVERLEGATATREAVIPAISSCTYLHFACHARYEWSDPLRSHLILARDTRLMLSDVLADVDLTSSRLVVLSACETGLIDLQRSPDEYVGLPAGFLQAGAPAVLSTLWPVDDESTRLLIERFYHGHVLQGLTPAAALREAQRWLMRTMDYAHPYYWAAFTLTGL